MGLFNRKKPEIRADTADGTLGVEDALLKAMLGTTGITKEIAMQIPTVAGAVDLIANIVASTPVKLYQLAAGKVVEIEDDRRLVLLNDETGDTLNAREFWRAIVPDYYLGKGGYAYINRERGAFAGLYYVDEAQVSIAKNADPIFKDYDILVGGHAYMPYDFLKILRNSKDGAQGVGITAENSKVLEVAYESLKFEGTLVKKGGNKKGFLKSEKPLDDPSINKLKKAWRRLYSNNEENVIILNKGMDFQESSNTSVEMQLNENKESNGKEICKIFHVSPDAITGKASDEDVASIAKLAAVPLMKTIECALNRDFLLEREKGTLYWAFDTKELLKGGMKERFEAYKAGIEANVLQIDEARYMEDLPALGFKFIKLGLQDVFYDPKTGEFFTPNRGAVETMNRLGSAPGKESEVKP